MNMDIVLDNFHNIDRPYFQVYDGPFAEFLKKILISTSRVCTDESIGGLIKGWLRVIKPGRILTFHSDQ